MSKHSSHHHGLAHDLEVMTSAMHRRQMLRISFGASIVAVLGCSDDGSGATDATTDDGSTGDGSSGNGSSGSSGDTPTTGDITSSSTGDTSSDPTTGDPSTTGDQVCTEIPNETEGPYPGDGTNGANALTLTGIVRSDIRQSIAGASGIAAGVPLTIVLTLVDESCAPLADHAIYLWHCNIDGAYSMYDAAVKDENYLRGVQATDADGQLTFQSIFPACYSGRWPHIHFEVYPSLASATTGKNNIKTSQLALPAASCAEVFATAGYEKSVQNLSQTSLQKDMVFSDGSDLQLAEIAGNVDDGYTIHLTITVPG